MALEHWRKWNLPALQTIERRYTGAQLCPHATAVNFLHRPNDTEHSKKPVCLKLYYIKPRNRWEFFKAIYKSTSHKIDWGRLKTFIAATVRFRFIFPVSLV